MEGRRTDTAERLIRAAPDRIWQAWFAPGALVRWLPPQGMTGEVLALDPVPGGAFRMVLTYAEASDAPGKSAPDRDEVAGRFVALDAPQGFALEIAFASDDPRFAGTMAMEWRLAGEGAATRVTVTCRNVPPGITAADHAAGLNASLDQLAAFVE